MPEHDDGEQNELDSRPVESVLDLGGVRVADGQPQEDGADREAAESDEHPASRHREL